MSEFVADAQTAYERGNALFRADEFDNASEIYGNGARICPRGELKTKLLLNKALCDLKLRLHDSVIKDCSCVLQCEPKNVKALLRRASAYEYASEFRKGLADVETVLSLPSVAPSLMKAAVSLSGRLNLLCRRDDRLRRMNTKQPDYLITNNEQCLRLNILDSDCENIRSDCGDYLGVNVCRGGGEIKFRVCVGNEFGLWNRKWMHCRQCSGEGIVTDAEAICEHMPAVRCEMALLLDVSGGQMGSCSQVATGARDCVCAPLNAHGKADVCMRLQLGSALAADAFIVAVFRFEVVATFPNAVCGCMNNVISVTSLPVRLGAIDPLPDITYSPESTQWLRLGSRVHAQSIREVLLCGGGAEVPAGSVAGPVPVYVFESPGFLGIGGKIWDSSYVLLSYLFSIEVGAGEGGVDMQLVQGRRVLELGSGTGVTGLALGVLQPASLLLSDLAEVVPLLEDNTDLNELMRTRGGGSEDRGDSPFVSLALPWGTPLQEVVARVGAVTMETFEALDTIVASDVIYDPTYYQPLVDTLHHLLLLPRPGAASDRVCVLAHRHRHPEDHKFFDLMADSTDLYIRQIPYHHTTVHGDTLLKDVKIFHIGRK